MVNEITHYIYVAQTNFSDVTGISEERINKQLSKKIIGEVGFNSYTESQYSTYMSNECISLNPSKSEDVAKCLLRVHDELGKNGTNATDLIEQIKVYGVKSSKDTHVDTEFHKFLKDNGKTKLTTINGSTTEIFDDITFEEVDKFMVAWTNNDPDIYRTKRIKKPYKYQSDIINEAMDILSRRQTILLYLSTRAGKSLISMEIARELFDKKSKELDSSWDNILIITPFPKAEGSFEDEGKRTNGKFMGWKYTHFDSETKVDQLSKNKNIIFMSTQMAVDEKEKDKIKPCVENLFKKLNFYVVIKDEIHNTMDSERILELLTPSINYQYTLNLSGTPFEDLLHGRFDADNTVVFDLLQFIEYSRQHPEEISLPNMNLNVVNNMRELQDILKNAIGDKLYSEIDNFNYSTLFSNSTYARPTMRWLFEDTRISPNSEFWFNPDNSKHVIMFFDNNNCVNNACNALNVDENGFAELNGEKYYIINAVNRDLSEKWINKKTKEHRRTCILSCGKLTTGVTLPKLDTVLLFRNVQSAELFIQIIFRTMTVADGKNDVNVYCFNPGSVIQTIKEFSAVRRLLPKFNESRDDITKQFLKCFNVRNLNLDTFEFTTYSISEYFRDVSLMSYQYSSEGTFTNLSFLKDYPNVQFELLKFAKKEVTHNNPLDVLNTKGTDNDITRKKNAERKRAKAEEALKEAEKEAANEKNEAKKQAAQKKVNEAKKLLESVKEENEKLSREMSQKVALLSHLNSVDKIIFTNLDKISKWEDVKNFVPPTLTDKVEIWEKAVEFNRLNIEDLISSLKHKLKDDKIKELINSFSATNPVDFTTPDELVNVMMLNFNKDMGTVAIDPTAGCGKLLEKLHEEKSIHRELCFGIELDPLNVEICHKLGFTHVIQGDATDPNVWDKLVNIMYDTLCSVYGWGGLRGIKEEIRIMNDKLGKDLLVFANPPYDRGLGGKIIENAKKYFPLAEYSLLMPLSCYKNLYPYVDLDTIIVTHGQGFDITIGDNNLILKLSSFAKNQSFEDLELATYEKEYLYILEDNMKHELLGDYDLLKDLGQLYENQLKELNYDPACMFIYSVYAGKNGVPNESPDKEWNLMDTSNKDLINFLGSPGCGRYSHRFVLCKTPSVKKGLADFYYLNGKEGLCNTLILGLNKAQGTIMNALPHIDWEYIQTTDKWLSGDLDGAVLDCYK